MYLNTPGFSAKACVELELEVFEVSLWGGEDFESLKEGIFTNLSLEIF